MKTRTIEQKVFEEIGKKSFSRIESELKEAAKHLSRLTGKQLEISTVNEDYVVFKPQDVKDVFLKARYQFTEHGTVKFNNFEKMVVSESSKIEERRSLLKGMIDALTEDDKDLASEKWTEFKNRFPIAEMVKKKASKAGNAPGDAGKDNADEEDQESQGKARSKRPEDGKYGSRTSSKGELMDLKAVDASLEEWLDSLPNYSEVKKHLAESAKKVAKVVCEEDTNVIKMKMKKKDKEEDEDKDKKDDEEDEKDEEEKDEEEDEDEVDEVEIDTKEKSDSKEKTSKSSKKQRDKVKKARKNFSDKEKDEDFSEKIVSLKRDNNAKDEASLGETLSGLVSSNPSLIYVSKNELKEMVSRILTTKKEKNWDDQLCEDIAFGLKKLAHNTYADQAYDIIKFAAVDEVFGLDEEVSDDDYEAFEQVSERYFNNIYDVAKKQYTALKDLSEMLAKAASILESDVKATGKDVSLVSKKIVEYREYSSKIAASARSLNESSENIVRMVVGSLLSKVAGDYSLNQTKFVDPGHFHVNWDMDKDDYKKHAKGGTKDTMTGDEEMSINNPMSPGSMGPEKLDLEKTADSKGFDVMQKGIHDNPMAPKSMGSDKLDLS